MPDWLVPETGSLMQSFAISSRLWPQLTKRGDFQNSSSLILIKKGCFLLCVYIPADSSHPGDWFYCNFLVEWIKHLQTANIISFISTYYEVSHGSVSQWSIDLPCWMLLHLPVWKWPLQWLAFFLATLNLLFNLEEIHNPCQFGGKGREMVHIFKKKKFLQCLCG